MRYDIAGNLWQSAMVFGPQTESFSSGGGTTVNANFIYIRKENTNRFFALNVLNNDFRPLTTNMFTDGTNVAGDKTWFKKYDSAGTVKWVYALSNSNVVLHRVMVF